LTLEVEPLRARKKALGVATLLGGAAGLCSSIGVISARWGSAPNSPLLTQHAGPSGADKPGPTSRVELDVGKLARAFGVPEPNPRVPSASVETVSSKKPSRAPVRSSLRGTLVGTAVAAPQRYSLCQITDPDTHETRVYRIGDRFMGARIYAMDRTRVFIENDGNIEYIEIDTSEATRPATTEYPGFAPQG
jgi:hypothetical protein